MVLGDLIPILQNYHRMYDITYKLHETGIVDADPIYLQLDDAVRATLTHFLENFLQPRMEEPE